MKGHSERVPDKSCRGLHGRPPHRWIVDTLLALPEVAHVVINTDAVGPFEAQGTAALPRVLQRERPAALRGFAQCILGSHNGSNTIEAAHRTSERALHLLSGFLHQGAPVA